MSYDSVTANAGSGGASFATDAIAGVKYPRTKVAFGAEGAATDASLANGFPVQPATGSAWVLGAGAAAIGSVTVTGNVAVTGTFWQATQPVSDGGGTISIDDGAGSITVDGTVAVSGTVTVASHAVTNAGTFPTQIDGAALTSLQLIDDVVLTEDAQHASGDKGIMPLAVRRDVNTTLADTTGDYAPLQVDASGSLKVAIISGAGSGGTSATDDAAFSVASGSGTPIMGLADETGPDAVDEGDVGVVRMTLSRGLHVNLRDASGAEVSVGGGAQYDEDAAHVSGSKVTGAGIVRKDTATSLAGTDGDYTLPIADANGKLWVNAEVTNGEPLTVIAQPLDDDTAGSVTGTGNYPGPSIVGLSTASVTVTGTFVATLVFEASNDGANYTAVSAVPAAGGAPVTSATTPGTWVVNVAGYSEFRVRCSAYTSGTATLAFHSSSGTGAVHLASALPAGSNAIGTVTANAGTGTFAISAASLPLPSGASTESTLSTLNGKVTACNTGAVVLAAGTAAFGKLAANDGVDVGDVTINNASGASAVNIQDGGNSITIDGSVSVSGVVAGTSATSLGKAEDAVAADGDTGVMALAVRKDTAATTVGADGDYHPLEVNANGRLWCSVLIDTALPAGTNAIGKLAANSGVDIGDVDVTSCALPTGASTAAKQPGLGTAGTASTDVITVQGIASMTALKVDGTGGSFPVTDSGGSLTVDNGGTFAVQVSSALPAGTNGIGKLTANSGVTPWLVTDTPATSGGLLMHSVISAGSTNAATVKASAGQVFSVEAFNLHTGPLYLKLYNKASAPIPGSDTPVKRLIIPSNGTNAAGFVFNIDKGLAFSTGIAYVLTTGIADSDNTATSANVATVNINYK